MIKTMYISPSEIMEYYGFNLKTKEKYAFIEPLDHIYKRLENPDCSEWLYTINGITDKMRKDVRRIRYFKNIDMGILCKASANDSQYIQYLYQNPDMRNNLGYQTLDSSHPYIWLAGYILNITGSIHGGGLYDDTIDIILPSSAADSIINDSFVLSNYFDTSKRNRYGSTMYIHLKQNPGSRFNFQDFYNFIISLYGYRPYSHDGGSIFIPSKIMTADKTIKTIYLDGVKESNKFWNTNNMALSKTFSNRSAYLTYRLLLDSMGIEYITNPGDMERMTLIYNILSNGNLLKEPIWTSEPLKSSSKRLYSSKSTIAKKKVYGYHTSFQNTKDVILNGIIFHMD